MRRHHGLPAGQRSGAEHESLLPHRLCARVAAGKRARRRRHPCRPAAQEQTHRHCRRHTARDPARRERAHDQRQTLPAGDRYAGRFLRRDDDERPRGRRHRRRRPVGPDGRLLRHEGERAGDGRAAGEGTQRTAARLLHHHGRARRRPGMETPAQPADRGEPAGDQPAARKLRRAAARRQGPACQRRSPRVQTMRRFAGLLLYFLVLAGSPAAGEDAVAEPDGYRMQDYRTPTPATPKGARVLTTAQAAELWRAGGAVFIDVMPRPPRPGGLPPDTIWRDKPRHNIPGSIWLPDTGYGALAAATEDYLKKGLAQASGGDQTKQLVVYCQKDCWMSWNAAKRTLALGYRNVARVPDPINGCHDPRPP